MLFASRGPLGGPLLAFLGRLGSLLGRLEAILGVLERSSAIVVVSWAILGLLDSGKVTGNTPEAPKSARARPGNWGSGP